MADLRFTTLVAAPLTVGFDVARRLGGPWPVPLEEIEALRPVRIVHAGRRGRAWITRSRRFAATAAGTVVEEEVSWGTGLPSVLSDLVDRTLLRPRIARAMAAQLDLYAAAAARAALDVVQVVGAAVVEKDRLLVAQRAGDRYEGCWEFPGGKVEPGESDLSALVREIEEELGVTIVPGAFVGEVPLDGSVGGGAPGMSTMRVWEARLTDGRPVAREHAQLRWVTADELDALEWIPADRPLLPAVRTLLRPR